MISKDFTEKQIRRFGGLDDYPRWSPEGEAELVIVGRKFSRCEAHLQTIADEVIAIWTKCPKPSELRSLLERDHSDFVDPQCVFCAGSGWKIVEKDGVSGAARCPCGSVPPRPGLAPPWPEEDTRKRGDISDFTKISELIQ